jgi:hypothetical protein
MSSSSVLRLLVQLLITMAAVGVAIPFVVGVFLSRGFRLIGVEEFDLRHTFKIACSASVAAFCLLLIVSFFLPRELPEWSGIVINAAAIVVGQLLVLPFLVRRYTPRALAVEAGAVLLGNLIVLTAVYSMRDLIPS